MKEANLTRSTCLQPTCLHPKPPGSFLSVGQTNFEKNLVYSLSLRQK